MIFKDSASRHQKVPMIPTYLALFSSCLPRLIPSFCLKPLFVCRLLCARSSRQLILVSLCGISWSLCVRLTHQFMWDQLVTLCETNLSVYLGSVGHFMSDQLLSLYGFSWSVLSDGQCVGSAGHFMSYHLLSLYGISWSVFSDGQSLWEQLVTLCQISSSVYVGSAGHFM